MGLFHFVLGSGFGARGAFLGGIHGGLGVLHGRFAGVHGVIGLGLAPSTGDEEAH